MAISRRAALACKFDDSPVKSSTKVSEDAHLAITKSKGCINMGTASNYLMEEELLERFNRDGMFAMTGETQHYVEFRGMKSCRQAVADFLTRHLKPLEPIDPDHICLTTGSTSALDTMAHLLADPDDVILAPTPCYGRIFSDFQEKGLANVLPVYLSEKQNKDGIKFELRADIVEDRIVEVKAAGKNVKAIVIINPHNPLGEVYSPKLMREIMEVCKRHEIHLVCDEVYALSIFEPDIPFTSVLAMEQVDPHRTHFLWSLSKDFGASGLRFGVIHTTNPSIQKAMKTLSSYNNIPAVVQTAVTNVLNDIEWCDDFFLPESRRRLQSAYKEIKTRLEIMKLAVRKGKSGFFAWVDMTSLLDANTKQAEEDLFLQFLNAGIYIVPGLQFYCKQPGWFRIIFSVKPECLQVGLDRLEQVVNSRRNRAKMG